jgi:hypothetical protein
MKQMKLLATLLLIPCLSLTVPAREISKKPDFIQKNENGEVTLRGVYTTDDSGYVIRYALYNSEGSLIETAIPYYSNNGRLLEIRQYGADGKLAEVIVFIGDRMVGLSPEGQKLDKYEGTKVDMEAFLKHFRDKS